MLLLLMVVVVGVEGHGRLIEPPSRSSMWRYGFDTPPNYNDHELYCGGFSRQWATNGGKCGICGDPWDAPQPRLNEAGGKFGNGIITRRYRVNQAIKVKIELTANHMGHFEFRICPNNAKKRVATQACLDKHLISMRRDGPNYYPGPGNKVFEMIYQLPKGLTCTQCVFQWRYFAANNWGECGNGTGAVGCGPQEEFRACSDIAITEQDGSANNIPNMDLDFLNPDTTHNEVDFQQDHEEHEDNDEEEEELFSGQRLAIIILATLLTTFMLFCAIFLYYYKAKDYVNKLIAEKDLQLPALPNLPNLPSLPSFSGVKAPNMRNLCKLDKLDRVTWPLSGISLSDALPSFLQKDSVKTVGPVAPVPPPRARRSKPGSPLPRLATIQPRSHPRPPGPPPTRPQVAPLEISAPTEVTINGVTFDRSSPMSNTAAGPQPSSAGIICAARPAVVLSDVPDSSLEISMPSVPVNYSVPSPLPPFQGHSAQIPTFTHSPPTHQKSLAPQPGHHKSPAPPPPPHFKSPPPLPTPSPRLPNSYVPPPPPSIPASAIPPPLPTCPPPPDSFTELDLDDSTDA